MSDLKPKILFVCSLNQWRSPTAERLYKNDQRVEVRSAGIRNAARRVISRSDLEWADLVVVMEDFHKSFILDNFRDVTLPSIAVLEITDEHSYMDKQLIEILTSQMEPIICELISD